LGGLGDCSGARDGGAGADTGRGAAYLGAALWELRAAAAPAPSAGARHEGLGAL